MAAKKKVEKPSEYSYVLRYSTEVSPLTLQGTLVANPHYAERHEPTTGASIGDWEPPRQQRAEFELHYAALRRLIKDGEWATPVSLAAFPGETEGSKPVLYVLSGNAIAWTYKDLELPMPAVIACHNDAFDDLEPVSRPESALPKGLLHWYDACGWRYASPITGLVVPERPVQLFR